MMSIVVISKKRKMEFRLKKSDSDRRHYLYARQLPFRSGVGGGQRRRLTGAVELFSVTV